MADKVTSLMVAALQRHVTSTGETDTPYIVPWHYLTIARDIHYEPPYNDGTYTRANGFNYAAFCDEAKRDGHFDNISFLEDGIAIAKGTYIMDDGSDESGTTNAFPYSLFSPARGEHGQLLLRPLLFVDRVCPDDGERAISSRLCSIFDLLAIMAAQDAIAAGRETDAKMMIGVLPPLGYTAEAGNGYDPMPKLTEQQKREILSHLGETGPLQMRTSKPWTAAMGASTRLGTMTDPDTGQPYITAGSNDELTIYTGDGELLVVNPGESMLLAHLNNLITEKQNIREDNGITTVMTSYDAILGQRGKSVTRKNKETVRAQLNALATTHWCFVDSRGTDHLINLITSRRIHKNGDISVSFTPEFMTYIMGSRNGILAVDKLLMTIDNNRFHHAWAIGYKIATHMHQNYGKPNERRLGVKNLLRYVKSIPTYDEVSEKDRAYTKQIIAPMERNLDHLVEIGYLVYWEYCHENGNPLTDEEQDARIDGAGEVTALPYDIAIRCNIEWEPAHPFEGHRQTLLDVRAQRASR